MQTERRRRRSSHVSVALGYQLEDCCRDGQIEAMVVANEDGLPLASAGDTNVCDEVAARVALVGTRIREFNGVLLGDGARWEVQVKKLMVDGYEILVCAVGGSPDQRQKQISRGADGAFRILAA